MTADCGGAVCGAVTCQCAAIEARLTELEVQGRLPKTKVNALQEANAALAARVRELEEAVGELLGSLDLTDHSPPCDESCSTWIEWGECTCGRAGSIWR